MIPFEKKKLHVQSHQIGKKNEKKGNLHIPLGQFSIFNDVQKMKIQQYNAIS